jgi:hypothetical protein
MKAPLAGVLLLAMIPLSQSEAFAAAGESVGNRQIKAELSASQVGRFEKIEFTFPIKAVGENPYDPADIDFRVELTAPSGRKLWIPAFCYQAFDRGATERRQGPELLYPVGPLVWKARFAPAEIGAYRGVAVLNDRAGTVRSEAFQFQSAASTNHGYLRVSQKDRRYLEFDDGAPFFAIGQNVAFIKDTRAQSEMLQKFGANGGNFARVWACAEDWGLAIEARKSAWGRSWDWNPPFAIAPDATGFHANKLCLKLSGEAGAAITMNPCYPVTLRPQTAHTFSGALRAGDNVGISFDLGGPQTINGKRQWTPFKITFTNQNQGALPNLAFRLTAKGTAWLRDLSLKESADGPELLWEADPNRPPLGVYNQVDCDMLDRIVAAAEQSGVHLQIVFLTRDHYMSSLSQNGGRKYETATDYAQRLARYCAARWGYSTHVAAWEYFNEMDPGLPTEEFYTRLARHFDVVDVNRHLRVNSTWHSPSKDYAHPDLDVANMHHYLRPPSGEIWKDEVASILAQEKLNQARLKDKPLFFAEFGITDANWQRAPELTNDKEFVHLHNALWLTTARGFGSTVCHWYWDDIEKRNLYPIYQPLARFVADIPFTSGKLAPTSATADQDLRVFGQQSDSFAYLWLWNPQATWWRIAMENQSPAPTKGAKATIPNLSPGQYQMQWCDTRTGKIVSETRVRVEKQPVVLEVPEFSRDVAVKLVRQP